MEQNYDLKKIESELVDVLSKNKKDWWQTYKLLQIVKENELFCKLPCNYKNYTEWIRDFAKRNKISEATLFQRLNAGRVYNAHRLRMLKDDIIVEDPEDINVSSTTLTCIERLARNNTTEMDRLIRLAVKGDINRKNIQLAWKIKKEDLAVKRGSRFNNICNLNGGIFRIDENKKIHASDIVLVLEEQNWLHNRRRFADEDKVVYKSFTKVNTANRYVHYVALENYTVPTEKKREELHASGVVICLTREELIELEKLKDIEPFFDYVFLVVSKEIIEDAKKILPQRWGLMEAEMHSLRIVKEPQKQDAKMKHFTLMKYIMR